MLVRKRGVVGVPFGNYLSLLLHGRGFGWAFQICLPLQLSPVAIRNALATKGSVEFSFDTKDNRMGVFLGTVLLMVLVRVSLPL